MNTLEAIAQLAEEVRQLLKRGDTETALAAAMAGCRGFLLEDAASTRDALFAQVFGQFRGRRGAQYQPADFEVVDYELYRPVHDLPLMRGPRPSPADIASGNYCVVLGAAQFFGRLAPTSIGHLISRRFGLSAVNLSIGGAGPGTYLRPSVTDLTRRARFAVVEILSGRSIGCDEYPGGRMTAPAADPDATLQPRTRILHEIWKRSRPEAMRLVERWNANYVAAYRELTGTLGCPVILAWISERSPEDWNPAAFEADGDAGSFPQLVSREMVSQVAQGTAGLVEGPPDTGLPSRVVSRFTGEPCPFFVIGSAEPKPKMENRYYASPQATFELFERLAPAIDDVLRRARPDQR